MVDILYSVEKVQCTLYSVHCALCINIALSNNRVSDVHEKPRLSVNQIISECMLVYLNYRCIR